MKSKPMKAVLGWQKDVHINIPFHDVDVLEIAWHGHYVKYAEIARHALMSDIGYDYPEMKASGYAYPIIEINFRYLRPAKYGQQLTVRAVLEEYQNRLRVAYLMLNEAGEECCKGYTVQVAVHALTKEMSFVTPSVFQQLVERSV